MPLAIILDNIDLVTRQTLSFSGGAAAAGAPRTSKRRHSAPQRLRGASTERSRSPGSSAMAWQALAWKAAAAPAGASRVNSASSSPAPRRPRYRVSADKSFAKVVSTRERMPVLA